MVSPQQRLKLTWEDPVTGEQREPNLPLPIALGREFSQMPQEIAGQRIARVVLNSNEVSRFHALIDYSGGNFVITDQNSTNGIMVNGKSQQQAVLSEGDTITIGPYQITVNWGISSSSPTRVANPANSQILFNPETNILDPAAPVQAIAVTPSGRSFPPPVFEQPMVTLQDLHSTGLAVDEIDYLTIGAGIGSFVFADMMRIFGVKTHQIIALGIEDKPYSRYKQLCLNSQIPLHERLRSNSDSCPDNIWGFPSYAWREAWHDLFKGNLTSSLRYLWQVFGEPTLVQTYTPRANNVFDSFEREMERISWRGMYRYGRVLAIRQTTDGRYAIAYSRGTPQRRERAFLVSRYVHLATGYPAIKFLPDLQDYRLKTQDFDSVVNAYENHDHVYQNLQQKGGTVLIRGRGIVASRIIQRIFEIRQYNPNIRVIHLMRSPKPQGNKFAKAQRKVEHHFEFQPFNWPKACWGGDLRFQLEKANSETRKSLISDWGGTTTADRLDWRLMVEDGLQRGWYRIEFGQVERVEKEANGIVTYIQERKFRGSLRLEADYIIDATGLDADVTASPLLKDLVDHYNLPLNYAGRLAVSNDFELEQMRTSQGMMHASGAITLGGPYAAVDSFLGLQYSALKIVDHLAAQKAPGLKKLNFLGSTIQWFKWALNQSPG
ncbi:MAG: FHA domain-containing protein [Cyanobacteria bacterium J083]|nr:MAG: FHA domain-containing protein [Cyanobacteria bacterium J083]